MLGAIVGDIVGSRFEFNNNRTKNFELFNKECYISDDSILTLAVAKAIMESEKILKFSLASHFKRDEYCKILKQQTIKYLKEFGKKYPNSGYGSMFYQWIFNHNSYPYNSYGNGAAMRISPVAYFAKTIEEIYKLSNCVTSVTHSHKEGLKGAQAVAVSIFLIRCGLHKHEIKQKIEKDYYDLNFSIDEIRDNYNFNESCQGSVPQAIVCFLESESFEDAIRIAVSLGGDSDTIAAITGSIAQAFYQIPKNIELKALTYLDEYLIEVYNSWQNFIEHKQCEY